MPRKTLFIIASVFFAVLAVVAANIYLGEQARNVKVQAKRDFARSQSMQGTVVIAKDDIAKGTLIEPGMLDTKIMLKEYIEPKAVQYPERIVGMKTLVPISKDEQITLNKLMSAKEVSTTTSLAMATPVGKRAITIPVDNLASLLGMLRPGDYVDVIATIPMPAQGIDGKPILQPTTVPLFQNVLVLTVGTQMSSSAMVPQSRYGEAKQQNQPTDAVTLALSPTEANLMAFVQEQGRIRLSLRSPADSRVEPVQVGNWDNLFAYLLPQQVKEKLLADQIKKEDQQKAVVGASRPLTREIEIFRGLKKETIPVSSSN